MYAINPTSFGGSLSRGKRKAARPIATRRPMHIVFRSKRAVGKWSFLRGGNAEIIEGKLESVSRRFEVRVYRFANVGNHFHLVVQVRRRADLQNFLRVFAQVVAFAITGTAKGRPVGKFWDGLAFTRIVDWGFDWRTVLLYIEKNALQAARIPADRVVAWYRLKTRILRSVGRSRRRPGLR